jgi:ribonuclease Z
MDTRPCEGAEALAEAADLLVCESTFLEDARELAERAGHMTARQAAALAARAGARRLMLTHFSQRYPDATAFLEEARPLFSGVVVAEEPGLEGGPRPVQVPPRR